METLWRRCGDNSGCISSHNSRHKAKRVATKRSESPQSEASRRNRNGFTLVETILYVAIASIFFTMAIGFFWQVRGGEVKASTTREVKENSAQAVEAFKYYVRNANGMDQGASQFGVNPGVLYLAYTEGSRVFDTYRKNVDVGGITKTIRKFRFTQSGDTYDLTSDHVEVETLIFSNFTQGKEPVVQMELTLKGVSVNNDPNYNVSLSVRTSVNVRQEL